MSGDGTQRTANGVEERGWVEAAGDMIDEAGDAPAGGLRGIGPSDPAQHLLRPIGGGGGEAAGLEFGQRDALVVAKVGVAGPEEGPADGLGELAAARLGLAHLVDGRGEDLDDVEPVDGDGGLGEAGGERRQEGR